MMGMVFVVLVGFAGLVWFVYRRAVKQGADYSPEGKIRWGEQETT